MSKRASEKADGVVRTPRDASAICDFVIAKLAEVLKVEPSGVRTDVPFAELGLSSREAVSLVGSLETFLSRSVPVTTLFEHPTVAGLAQRLANPGDLRSSTLPDGRPPVTDRGIAIIGVGCRLPGASGPGSFWELLRGGVDAIGEVPSDRWDARAMFDPTGRAPGKVASREGGFISDVDRFDAGFFSISAREAARMDPQQRILLEVAWEALEDAGVPMDAIAGTDTGVFVGISTNDYAHEEAADAIVGDAYAGSGNAFSVAANRLSYFLDLHGPSLAVDTACSSSLVAVHLACDSLRRGECGLAIVGGVNLILNPALSMHFSKAGLLAVDGRCKTFDARADGYGRGEGAAVVILKPVERAVEDGDLIYAVIKGSAVNSDGRSNGLMAPNGKAQVAVVRAAHRAAGIEPADVAYVELHGTGTLLGDPIEASALGTVLEGGGEVADKCAVGSVKSNIGHLEAAAGIAGVVKVALSLLNRKLPPSLHFERPNPHIDFDRLPLRVQCELGEWPAHPKAAAGVSSFGFGGTNAHAVLVGPPDAPLPTAPIEVPPEGRGPYLFPVSARSLVALRALAERMALHVSDMAGPLSELSSALCVRRTHHEFRAAVMASTHSELAAALATFARGQADPGVTFSETRRDASAGVRVVFAYRGIDGRLPGTPPTLAFMDAYRRPFLQAAEVHRDRTARELPLFASDDDAARDETDRKIAYAVHQVASVRALRALGVSPALEVYDERSVLARECVRGALSIPSLVRVAGPGLPDEVPDADDLRLAQEALERAGELASVDAQLAALGLPRPDSIVVSIGVAHGDPAGLLREVARLYVAGFDLKFAHLFSACVRRVPLPTYPWQRTRHWIEKSRSASPSVAKTPFVGAPLDVALGPATYVWQGQLNARSYLAHHRVGGQIVMPASGFVDLACAATESLLGARAVAIRNMLYERPLAIADRDESRVQVEMTSRGEGDFHFQISSRTASTAWAPCARGSVSTVPRNEGSGSPTVTPPARIAEAPYGNIQEGTP